MTLKKVDRLKTKLIVQGANIPVQIEAEQHLHKKGIVSIPDFIANAGGVICAAVEYRKGSESEALRLIQEKVGENTRVVLQQAEEKQCTPREAANELALERVKSAQLSRRFK